MRATSTAKQNRRRTCSKSAWRRLKGGVAALAFASGAAAVTTALQELVHAGQHIVFETTIWRHLQSSCAHLPDFGIETTFCRSGRWRSASRRQFGKHAGRYIESMRQSDANLVDIRGGRRRRYCTSTAFRSSSIRRLRRHAQLRPIRHGADIVVHSAAKFIGGHGTTLGGIVVDSGKFDWTASGRFPWLVEAERDTAGLPSRRRRRRRFRRLFIALLLRDTELGDLPFNAFLLLQGVETLSCARA